MSVEIVNLTPDEARELTEQIRAAVIETRELIERAYRDRVWIALGYDSWQAWFDGEQMPTLDRSDIQALSDAGLSQRAIATVIGTSKDTVGRQLSHVETVAETIGRDGKTRPRKHLLPHEIERRRDHVVDLWWQGVDSYAIAAALGVKPRVIDYDLRARHVDLKRHKGPHPKHVDLSRSAERPNRPGLIEPIKWRDADLGIVTLPTPKPISPPTPPPGLAPDDLDEAAALVEALAVLTGRKGDLRIAELTARNLSADLESIVESIDDKHLAASLRAARRHVEQARVIIRDRLTSLGIEPVEL